MPEICPIRGIAAAGDGDPRNHGSSQIPGKYGVLRVH